MASRPFPVCRTFTPAKGCLFPLADDADLKLIRVCKEDEGIGICAGLSYCDKRALLLMQYSGMLDSINALRIVGVEYGLPICMMVGLLNKEPGVLPENSKHYSVRITGADPRCHGRDASLRSKPMRTLQRYAR